jgi:hypothetical protein
MRVTSWRMARSRMFVSLRSSLWSPQLIYSSTSVEVTEDTKIPNAATIKIVKQDHTLGNMLRA